MSEPKIVSYRMVPAAAAALLLGAAALAQTDPCTCVVPEVDAGIVALPGPCPYGSPSGQPLLITEGLPPQSTLQSNFNVDSFFDVTYRVGTPTDPNGQVQQYQGLMTLQMQGTGALQDFSRTLTLPVQIETHTGPTNLSDPVQSFPNEMVQLQAEIFGDPDFDVLRITAGSGNGLPGGGGTTITQLPTGDWQVDSFFDITYQIEFQGAPGSVLEGMGGTTTAAVDYGNNAPGAPPCTMPTPNAGFIAAPFPCPEYPPSGAPIDFPTGNPDIQLHGNWNVDSFFDIVYRTDPGTGQPMYVHGGVMHLNIGSSGLDGYTRQLDVPFSRCYTLGTGTGIADMLTFDLQLPPGDPDFDLLRMTGGSQLGLPSPGQITLTELPSGNFNVDSFFDITYQIEFQGTPGGALDGLGGSTLDSLQMQQGAPLPQVVTAHGLTNTSLCNADLALDASGHLVVSNIGSSGLDGVRIDLDEADGFGTDIASTPMDSIFWDLFWTDPDPAASVKWCLGQHQQAGTPDSFFDIDVSGYEPQEIRVTILDQFVPVATQTYDSSHTGPLVVSNIGSSGKDGVRQSAAHSSRVDSFFDICYTVDFSANFPGQPPVTGNRLRFEIIAPPGQTAPTGPKEGIVRFVWAGLPPCPGVEFTRESMHIFDSLHTALGEAQMSSSGGHLTVSNIGSSGCDGVSIDCPCLPCPPQCFCHPGWAVDYGPPLPPGSSLFFDVFIPPPPPTGLPDKALCLRLDGTQGGTGMLFDPGSLPFEPPFIRVDLFDNGSPVGTQTYSPPYSGHLVISNIGSSGKDGVSFDAGCCDDDCDGYAKVRVQNPFPTETQFPGGPIVVADEIVMCIGPGPVTFPSSLPRVDFRGIDIPQITLIDRFDFPEPPCPGDSNGDGAVDVNDLNNVILDWGTDGSANGGDLTDASGTGPPDGIVDVNDLNAVIVNWGPCIPPAPAEAPAPKTRGGPKSAKPAKSAGPKARTTR